MDGSRPSQTNLFTVSLFESGSKEGSHIIYGGFVPKNLFSITHPFSCFFFFTHAIDFLDTLGSCTWKFWIWLISSLCCHLTCPSIPEDL